MKNLLLLILLMCLPFTVPSQNQPLAFNISPIVYQTQLIGTSTITLLSDTANIVILNVCGVGTDSTCVTYNLYRDSTLSQFVQGGVRNIANEAMPDFSDSTDIAGLNAIFGPLVGIEVLSQRPSAP